MPQPKPIKASLERIPLVSVEGKLTLQTKIYDGPDQFLDRRVTVVIAANQLQELKNAIQFCEDCRLNRGLAKE